MTTTLIRQPAHLRLVAPRGAVWAAEFAVAVYRLFERVGASRASRALRAEADKWQSIDPQRAEVLRSAEAHLTNQAVTRPSHASSPAPAANSPWKSERGTRSAIF